MAGISIETSIIEFITFDGALKCMVAAKTLPMIRMSLICNGNRGNKWTGSTTLAVLYWSMLDVRSK